MKLAAWLVAALMSPIAHANALSYVGSLDTNDPNDVFTAESTLLAPSAVTIQTWSFGGGTNAAGNAIAAGGFDPYVSLFDARGRGRPSSRRTTTACARPATLRSDAPTRR